MVRLFKPKSIAMKPTCLTFLLLLQLATIAQETGIKKYKIPFKPGDFSYSFSVIGNSSIPLAAKGGVYDIAMGCWLIKPMEKMNIVNFAICYADTSLIISQFNGNKIIISKAKNSNWGYINKQYCSLNRGNYHLISVGIDSFYVINRSATSEIFFFSPSTGLVKIFSKQEVIGSFTSIMASSIFYSIKNQLFALTPDSPPKRLAVMPAAIDGIAISDNSNFLISTKDGIYILNTDKRITKITDRVHGALSSFKNKIFVADWDRNEIIEFASELY